MCMCVCGGSPRVIELFYCVVNSSLLLICRVFSVYELHLPMSQEHTPKEIKLLFPSVGSRYNLFEI